MINTQAFYNYLVKNNFTFFAGVPDSLLNNLCACISNSINSNSNIITANEGNALAMCAGYHLATGKYGVAYMQNSGEGNIINPLLSLVDEEVYSIPVLIIIGWRGEPGVHDEPQHIKQGKLTIPLLKTLGVDYSVLTEDYKPIIDSATEVLSKNKPYALVIKKNLFSPYSFNIQESNYQLNREQALETILSNLSSADIVVSTTGKTSREIFEIREKNQQGHSNDFLTVGSMGHTSSIAYGIALGTTSKVYCIDGDGSFIMHMGALAVIGANPVNNFKYILNDNSAHESVGGQPTCSKKLNLQEILEGFGFNRVYCAETREDLIQSMHFLKNDGMAALIIRTRQGSRKDLGRPTTTPIENKFAMMSKLEVSRK